MIVLYSAFTLHRNYVFSDGIRLWSDVIRKAPGSDRAHCVLATNYLNYYEAKNLPTMDYLDISENEFLEAIKINNWNNTAHCNLSKVYYLKGEYDNCIYEAQVTNNHEESVYAYHNLGLAYKAQGKITDALEAFNRGYELDNRLTFIVKALGNTYYDTNDLENASKYYKEYLELTNDKEIKQRLEEINTKLGK
jgi:tetratricopeptide (TPR) repeat protein